jgi:putative transposase
MRTPRKLLEGSEYHVVARINRREFLLQPDFVKQMFLDVVAEAKRKYRFAIRNFCVMDNHIHLMILPFRGENLSRIMQWILGVFAIRFNRRHGYTGHVWYDRFKSTIITTFRRWISTFQYIDLNPVRADMTKYVVSYRYGGVYHMRKGKTEVIERPVESLRLQFPEICQEALPDSRVT